MLGKLLAQAPDDPRIEFGLSAVNSGPRHNVWAFLNFFQQGPQINGVGLAVHLSAKPNQNRRRVRRLKPNPQVAPVGLKPWVTLVQFSNFAKLPAQEKQLVAVLRDPLDVIPPVVP
jgi:hypothetical protein